MKARIPLLDQSVEAAIHDVNNASRESVDSSPRARPIRSGLSCGNRRNSSARLTVNSSPSHNSWRQGIGVGNVLGTYGTSGNNQTMGQSVAIDQSDLREFRWLNSFIVASNQYRAMSIGRLSHPLEPENSLSLLGAGFTRKAVRTIGLTSLLEIQLCM